MINWHSWVQLASRFRLTVSATGKGGDAEEILDYPEAGQETIAEATHDECKVLLLAVDKIYRC